MRKLNKVNVIEFFSKVVEKFNILLIVIMILMLIFKVFKIVKNFIFCLVFECLRCRN